MRQIAVLLTCHNRKDKTLSCLAALFQSQLPIDVSIVVYLVDDGSIDGTGTSVRSAFPQVKVFTGNGNLFWAGGMRQAWKEASNTDYEYYLWLNDDTQIYGDAIKTLLEVCGPESSQKSVCGSTIDPRNIDRWTYGGFDSNRKLIIPDSVAHECDFFNGNLVLIPRAVFQKLGNIEKSYTHSLGDFDYGIRAKKAGVKILVAPGCQGECESHDRQPRWCRNEGTPWKRLKHLYEPLGCNPFEFFIFDSRQNGNTIAFWHFLTLHVRAIAPFLWKESL